jgi:hypothetical protein
VRAAFDAQHLAVVAAPPVPPKAKVAKSGEEHRPADGVDPSEEFSSESIMRMLKVDVYSSVFVANCFCSLQTVFLFSSIKIQIFMFF